MQIVAATTRVGAGLLAAIALTTTGCSSSRPVSPATVTVTSYGSAVTITQTAAAAPATSTPPTNGRSYGGSQRVMSVGDQPRGGLAYSIPPGRYRVVVDNDKYGTWIRCRSELCGIEYTENIITIGNCRGPNYSAVMQVEPSDVAIAVIGVTLVSVD